MDTVESLRSAIARVFHSWEEYPSAISRFRIDGVMDTARDRYTLTHVNMEGETLPLALDGASRNTKR